MIRLSEIVTTGGGTSTSIFAAYDKGGNIRMGGTWTELTSGATARRQPAAVVYNGKMYVFGGYDGSNPFKDLWEYDISTDSWTELTSGATARRVHTAVVYNGKMYVFGGYDGSNLNDLWEYDISTDSWTELTSGATARRVHTAVVYNGKMYVFGGYDGTNNFNDLWEYDISTDSWTELTSGATARRQHTAVVYNGKMYVFGGYDGSNLNDLWEYDISTDSWTQLTSGATARRQHSAVVYNGKMSVFGGYDGSDLNDLWEYDISTDSWTELTSGATARRQPAAVVYNGKMYVFGGYDGTNNFNDLWRYLIVGIIDWDTVRRSDSRYTLSNGEITIDTAGDYTISADISTYITSSTSDRTTSVAWLEVDTGDGRGFRGLEGTETWMYNRLDGNSQNTGSIQYLVSANAGDVYRVVGRRNDTGDVISTLPEGCRITIEESGGGSSGVDVEDDDSTVVSGATAINAGAGLEANDDGDGTATIQTQTGVAYGVKYDQANDVMEKGIVLNNTFIPQAILSTPVQNKYRRCMRKPDGTITGYCDPNDSTKYEDGTSIVFDGSEGDLQVEAPKHHELFLRIGSTFYILVGESAFTFLGQNSYVPEHFSANNTDYYYYDALENVLYDDSAGSLIDGDGNGGADTSADYLRSLPGYKVWTNETRAAMRSLAANRTGTTHQHSWSSYQSLVALFLTKYGTWASQTALPGYTEASSWDFAYTRETGRTLSLGNADGSIEADLTGTDSDLDGIVSSGDYIANSFLGIENPFGHIWKFVDGVNIDNTSGNCHVYVQADPSLYADDTATDYNDTGIAPGFGNNADYIKDINGNQHLAPAYPTVIGGSSSTYMRDYHWNDSGAWRVLLSGGTLSTGAEAGLVCLSAGNDSSSSSATVGARAGAF